MANYRVNLKYNTQRDAELIQRLEAQENKQDYIRRLIMSDIAADSLRGLLTLQDDVEQDRTNARIRFWENNCPASVDPGDSDPCSTCTYYSSFWGKCTLADEWEKVKNNGEI